MLGAKINYNLSPPFDYWVVDGTWVFEPNLSGKQLGELLQMNLKKRRENLTHHPTAV